MVCIQPSVNETCTNEEAEDERTSRGEEAGTTRRKFITYMFCQIWTFGVDVVPEIEEATNHRGKDGGGRAEPQTVSQYKTATADIFCLSITAGATGGSGGEYLRRKFK